MAHRLDYSPDGFSKPYQWALMANSILLFFIGLLVLRKVLNRFFTDKITAIVLLIIFFGTNYYSYSTFSAEMPHNYLFTIYAIILRQTILWHDSYKRKHLWALAIFIGLTTLARPTELISILIPLLWNITDKESLIQKN
jgi:TctA family transporter